MAPLDRKLRVSIVHRDVYHEILTLIFCCCFCMRILGMDDLALLCVYWLRIV